MALSDEAERLFEKIAAMYADAGFPGRRLCGYDAAGGGETRLLRELAAHGLMRQKNLGGTFELTEIGERRAVGAVQSQAVHIHTGPTTMSNRNINITNSNIGAFASDGGTATGSVHVETSFDQTQHDALMKKAKHAMVDDESSLDAATNEALWKLLKMASETKVAVDQLAAQQAKMKETVDELWATDAANGMRPQPLSPSLETVKVLLTNPVTAVAVKGLLGGV